MHLCIASVLILACACARALASPHLSSIPPDFVVAVNASRISMGRAVTVSIAWPSPPTPSGTVFWPFVNGSQWGAFVTCFVQPPAAAAAAAQPCTIELPLPYAGENTLQFAVFKEGATPAPACTALPSRLRSPRPPVGRRHQRL